MNPVIQIEDLHKSFGKMDVIRGIDLTVQEGEIVVLIGASGSGKSTFLRCLNRLETPTRGRIQFGSTELFPGGSRQSLDSARREIGMVFQRFNLFPHLTALDNVALAPRKVLKTPDAKAREEALTLLDRVHLGAKASNFPGELSGGQQQRVAIARALALHPKLLLFDEPTSALDPELVGEVLQAIKDLAQEGRTMIIATHEMGFAREVASRVLFLHEGRVLESGPPEEVLENPRELRTREFLARILNT